LLLSSTAIAQTGASSDASGANQTATTQHDDTPHHDYGWIGLLGLAGLAGLRKSAHNHPVDTRTNTR
jgi:hypothetical protein